MRFVVGFPPVGIVTKEHDGRRVGRFVGRFFLGMLAAYFVCVLIFNFTHYVL